MLNEKLILKFYLEIRLLKPKFKDNCSGVSERVYDVQHNL